MPSKQVEDVYNAMTPEERANLGGREVENKRDFISDDDASKAWRDALEVAARVAERRIAAGKADTIPAALRNLII